MSRYHPSCGHYGGYVMGIGENMYCGVCKIEVLEHFIMEIAIIHMVHSPETAHEKSFSKLCSFIAKHKIDVTTIKERIANPKIVDVDLEDL